MSYFNIVAETSENTVVTEYEPVAARSEAYQSEAALEAEFIKMLGEQGYEYLTLKDEAGLLANLRTQMERLNDYTFSDAEWERFRKDALLNANDGIVEKTRKIQEDFVQVLKRDDGSSKNIRIIDKAHVHNNFLQVINQYAVGQADGARHDNRYDVTILVNGLPLVHVELKRRGVPLKEAFNQIERYQRDSFWASSGLYEYVQIFVISNGTNTKYYSNTTRWNALKERSAGAHKAKTSNSFEFTSFWADANNRIIPDIVDFTRTFFARHTLLNILTRYCVFTSEDMLLVMRPYQITATERILNRIEIATNYKKAGTVAGGGYIWHTTGSGKTLTSFKTARLASTLPYIDKVLFVVDRKDLDYQTMKEYDRFEKGAANSNTSTTVLARQLADDNARIIITTINKLDIFIKKNPVHEVYAKHVVIIFDECHRSQFGDMHRAILKAFKKYHLFGFTGTPIFAANAPGPHGTQFFTTEQTFGDQLHTYTIVDAINDGNVLPFRVDYIKTMDKDDAIDDEKVWDIDREKAYLAPDRIKLVAQYIREHFNQKTYRQQQSYYLYKLMNISEVAAAERGAVKEEKVRQTVTGFNSILCVQSIEAARLYYEEFKRQQEDHPFERLKVATIFSFGANEAELSSGGLLSEENSESVDGMDQTSREFLESAIADYNAMFKTNYSTDAGRFENYYKDVSLRMKNKELDLLIVVNMFLTGFDATTLNTLWVDKNLRMHGLIQAFSRTNRILNSVKTFGNIVCFRNLQKRVDEAIALFGDKDAGGIVLLRTFDDYFNGYVDEKGKAHRGYVELLAELQEKFPLSEPRVVGEKAQEEFLKLFGAILRMRNVLRSFDEFGERDTLTARDLQDYTSRYQDTWTEWKARQPQRDQADINDDIVFEVELIKQIEINIDYILALVEKYRGSHGEDKELLVSIQSAIGSSPSLRSKEDLIEAFIANINTMEDDVLAAWRKHVAEQQEKELSAIIAEEHLKDAETRKFIEDSFANGEIKTIGTDIDKLMPPMSKFGAEGAKRKERKQKIIERLQVFFERFFGIR